MISLKKMCGKSIPLILFPFFIFQFNAFSEESPHLKNIIALGVITPIGTDKGILTPLIVWKYQSANERGDATLDIFLQTSTLTATNTHSIWPSFNFGYKLSGTMVSEGYGSDIYTNGSLAKELTYEGNSLSFSLFGKYLISNRLWVRGEISRQSLWFEQSKDNIETFSLPNNHLVDQNMISIAYEGGALSDKDKIDISFIGGTRDQWDNWGLDDEANSKKEFSRQQFKWETRFNQPKFGYLSTTFSAGTGADLDIISGYRVGGMASEYVVSGFYRNEFRVKDVMLLNVSQEIEFAKDRKLKLFGDIATFNRFDLNYSRSTPESQTISGLGIGFFYGIRSLKGLPIIVALGEGFNVHADSKEKQRREVSIIMAAAF